jgi:hypothetical protein
MHREFYGDIILYIRRFEYKDKEVKGLRRPKLSSKLCLLEGMESTSLFHRIFLSYSRNKDEFRRLTVLIFVIFIKHHQIVV